MPSQMMPCFVDIEMKETGFMRRSGVTTIFPPTGPVFENFLHKLPDAPV